MAHRITLAIAMLVILGVGDRAVAQSMPQSFPADRLRPAIDHDGIIDVEWAGVPKHLRYDAAMWFGFVRDPLVLYDEVDGERQRVAALLRQRLTATVVGSLGLFDWLELGLEMPFILSQQRGGRADSIAGLAALESRGTGDLRIVPKVTFLDSEHFGIDAALLVTVTVPTASADAYLGEDNASVIPELAVSRGLGALRLAANVGYRVRSRSELARLVVDDELVYRLGAAFRFDEGLDLPLEAAASLSGAFSAKRPFERTDETPLEVNGVLVYDAHLLVQVFAGAGMGLTTGFGTPAYRVFGGLRFVSPARVDRDGDGIADDEDRCPAEPEDRDGFEDWDGCPDLDNDHDGIPDSADAAPNQPEDQDGFQDGDGRPDPDNDGDGIEDSADKCPMSAETVNQWLDEDGCPDEVPDSDGDGIIETRDHCPSKAEDKDGFEDEDGCPDPDNDNDGVTDRKDMCPETAGPVENAGCPDTDRDGDGVVDRLDNCPDEPGDEDNRGCVKRQLVKLTTERIEISETVFFDTGRATIQKRSHGLLDNIVQVLRSHPEIKKLSIQGHTDSKGRAALNKVLSQRRAEAVMRYIVEHGIARGRLEAVGFGEEKPVASNETKKGRAANRRVEFNIVREVPAEDAKQN